MEGKTYESKENNKSNKEKLVSILMTNYNYENFIGESLESISKQKYSSIELIIVDDGSKDKSVDVIKGLYEKYKDRFIQFKTIFLQNNNGINAALNKGIKEVSGDITIIADADDKFSPYYVTITTSLLDRYKNTKIAFVYSNCNLIDKKSNKIGIGHSYPFSKELLQTESYIPSCGAVFTEVLKRAFPLDEKIKKGTKYKRWKDIVDAGYIGLFIEKPLFYYRMHENNVSGIGNKINKKNTRCLLSGYWELISNTS